MDYTNMDLSEIVVCGMFLSIIGLAYTAYANSPLITKIRKKRRWSVRPINKKRQNTGHFHNLFKDMATVDNEQFIKYTRMSQTNFYTLLGLVQHKLVKHSRREPISPEHRLVITLFYLSQGCSMQVVAWSFLIGKTTASVIIKETCEAIWVVLSPIYCKQPTVEEWKEIANEFYRQWNLPNCCGAIDDIGAYGSQNDGGVFLESAFGQGLESGKIKLPASTLLPNTDMNFPYYFVGDDAFPLKPYILRPYPGKNLNQKQKIFNYRLSRARRTIENSFGILASRWRILRNNIIAEVDNVEKIVAATVCLHNFLRISEKNAQEQVYCPLNFADTVRDDGHIIQGLFREEYVDNSFQRIGRMGSNNPLRSMIVLRNSMAHYLSREGAVPWQWEHVSRGSRPE